MNGNDTSLPPLNWLRAFESAARHLSFTSAAADLNMTQSAVSQQIKNLEHYLGRTLFIRRTRSIVMTDAGYAYLPVVQEAFETLATGTRMMTGGDRGAILSVQCNIAFSVFWLSTAAKSPSPRRDAAKEFSAAIKYETAAILKLDLSNPHTLSKVRKAL